MERFKTPTGRLSTIFYTSGIGRGKMHSDSAVFDEEKPPVLNTRATDLSLPPVRIKTQDAVTSMKKRFVWRDVSLDLQTGGENRQLLSGVSGKALTIRV
jgi:hypothetical protein